MLVLTRGVGDEIVIDGRIVVKVTKIQTGRRVWLGLKADPDVHIVRQELIDHAGESKRPVRRRERPSQ